MKPKDGTMNVEQAANIYSNSAKSAGTQSVSSASGDSFGDMLREATEKSIDTMHEGEQMSARAVMGDADLTDVVQAVTAAEMTLETVTAVRDRMISAYQETVSYTHLKLPTIYSV